MQKFSNKEGMLKGVEETVNLYVKQDPLSAAEKVNFSPLQDTLPPTQKPVQLFSIPQRSTADTIKLVSDTLSVKHSTYNFPFTEPKEIVGIHDNFLFNIPVSNRQISANANKLHTGNNQRAIIPVVPKKVEGFKGNLRQEANLDWFTVAIVVSLFVFSWMKVIYQKFVVQIVTGLVDYQVAMRLYREKNVLFRNVSIGLHSVFYINMGLYIFYLIDFYDYPQVFNNIFLSVFIYSLIILLIYNVKSLTSKILGYLFLVQENFAQYMHNVNLYNKNIGLFLFPIIIIYPFTQGETMKRIVIYAGLVLLLGLFLLRSYRSAQIILKKGISLFYLILYLCAVELLPVLLLIKFTSTLV